jgi:hypothetical protein
MATGSAVPQITQRWNIVRLSDFCSLPMPFSNSGSRIKLSALLGLGFLMVQDAGGIISDAT